MKTIEYNDISCNDRFESKCPYCGAYYNYCTADGIPDRGDGEVVECGECYKLFNIMAEASINWRTNIFSHVRLLVDIPYLNLKAGDIALSSATSKEGNYSIRYGGAHKLEVWEYYNICTDTDGFVEVSIKDAEWLGYPEDKNGQIYDPINKGVI